MNEQLMLRLQQIQSEGKEIEEKLQIVDQQVKELSQFSEGLKEFGKEKEKSNEILASVGKGVYVKSEMKEDSLFVDVGSGVLVKKSIDDTKQVVEEQLKKINEMKIHFGTQQEALNEELRTLIEEFQKAEEKESK